MQNKKDCTNCKSRYFDDHQQIILCHNPKKCEHWEKWGLKNMLKNDKFDYKDLREKIHSIFMDFLERELE